MGVARSDIVDREQRAERQFKMEARKAQKKIRKVKGWGVWLPQAGTVSGKKYYFHTETGEVIWGRHTVFLHARRRIHATLERCNDRQTQLLAMR